MNKTHYRTLWLSDIHLGNKDCKAEYLLTFLDSISVDTLYLVGDIVDMWQIKKKPMAYSRDRHDRPCHGGEPQFAFLTVEK